MRRATCITLFLGVVWLFSVEAQSFSTGTISQSIGGIFTTQSNFWSSLSNQAGLADINQLTIGAGYENPFLLKELSTKYAGIVLPVKESGSIGLSVQQAGNTLLNHTKIGLGYGMKMSKSFTAGVNLDYVHLHISDVYGNKGVLVFQAGCIYKLNETWTLGAHIFNPSMSKIATYNEERLETLIQAGCSYKASKQLTILSDIEKNINYKPSLKFGFDYGILDYLKIRGGISTQPVTYAFGFGLTLKTFSIDFASIYHSILGFSPSTSITYKFNKPTK